MAENTGASYSTDPALYIYTSLTAGSSHIVTATSRLETILRANRVPFKAVDIATDEKARMIWGRRAGKDDSGRVRKLPALIQTGLVLGDLVEIEEWNEYGELKQHVTIYYDDFTIPPKSQAQTPVAMRPLNQPFPKSGVAASSSSSATTTKSSNTTTATTATSAPAPAPPAPPAPPLPTDKDKTKIPLSSSTSTGNQSTAKKAANAAASVTTPIRSIAEEAAQKAKQANLDRLREKVHGKKDASPSLSTDKEKENKKHDTASQPPVTPKKTKETSLDSTVSEGMSTLTIGSDDKLAPGKTATAALQSPTSGTWRSGVLPDSGAQPLLQSPTTGTWKADASHSLQGRITELRGAVVASAPEEDIAAIEKAEAIPEEDSSEEEDSEEEESDEDEDEDESEDETEKVKAKGKN
ncbi:hypothetical protein HD806DRAFT_481746 [Xylariaceae sp. AK1471]|nr:hypothetical protein HD806DRAFT_481746 [Xylariaceae sp. AK1471]